MDFLLDRNATGRTLSCLTVFDEATHEAIAVPVAHAMGCKHLTRVLDEIRLLRGKPHVTRTDNGPEFTGKAMMIWAHRQRIEMQLIELGMPNKNSYVESFNGRLRDECLDERWFTSLDHARRVIETWRREYKEERPKRSLGGLMPTQHAQRLAQRVVAMPENSKPLCY
jgi:putative transposase